MKILTIVLSLFITVAFVGSAMAVMPGKTIELPDGAMGKVIFKGDTHSMKQGLKCSDCHPKIFGMKKGGFKMTKEDHGKPEYCGTCHDGKEHFGKVVFSQSNPDDCTKCHQKGAAPTTPETMPAPATPENK
jgi:c(7)-type cytochrome triheme protein